MFYTSFSVSLDIYALCMHYGKLMIQLRLFYTDSLKDKLQQQYTMTYTENWLEFYVNFNETIDTYDATDAKFIYCARSK